MFYGASPEVFAKAQILRLNPTNSERILWLLLQKSIPPGFRFKRQHPIGFFVADFYCHKARLVVELDGPYHLTRQFHFRDIIRDQFMKSLGLTVIRFTDREVFEEPELVLRTILKHLIPA